MELGQERAARTDLLDRGLKLIEDLRQVRKNLEDVGFFSSVEAPIYVKNRYRYWRLSKELLSCLDGIAEGEGGYLGLDMGRFGRNHERLRPQLGGWKLGSDESLATMAATLRGARQ